jgi:hypothetical protein
MRVGVDARALGGGGGDETYIRNVIRGLQPQPLHEQGAHLRIARHSQRRMIAFPRPTGK